MIDDRTPALDLPLPHPDNDIGGDVLRLRAALAQLDAALAVVGLQLDTDNPDLATLNQIGNAVAELQDTLTEFTEALINDSQVTSGTTWSSERIAAEVGRGSEASYTYTGGVLTSISETLPGGTRTTTLTYTSGVLSSMAVTYAGVTRTTTYSYTDGVLTSTATVES